MAAMMRNTMNILKIKKPKKNSAAPISMPAMMGLKMDVLILLFVVYIQEDEQKKELL